MNNERWDLWYNNVLRPARDCMRWRSRAFFRPAQPDKAEQRAIGLVLDDLENSSLFDFPSDWANRDPTSQDREVMMAGARALDPATFDWLSLQVGPRTRERLAAVLARSPGYQPVKVPAVQASLLERLIESVNRLAAAVEELRRPAENPS